MDTKLSIKDLPASERPRERLLRYGVETLSNEELLAIILGTGIKQEDVLQLSRRIIKEQGGLNGLLNSNIEDFLLLKGLGKAKGSKLMAVVELSKRFRTYKSGDEYKISKPKDVAELLMQEMKLLKKEVLKVVLLNTKNIVVSIKDVSMGSLNSSIVHPREVFLEAIKKSAASIIVCHNHPSGDPSPSKEDVNITIRLKECGKLLGIELLDHIIIGNEAFISLKEKGIL